MNIYQDYLEASISNFESIDAGSVLMLSSAIGLCERRGDKTPLLSKAHRLLRKNITASIEAVKFFGLGDPIEEVKEFEKISSSETIDEEYPPSEEAEDYLLGIYQRRDGAELMWHILDKHAPRQQWLILAKIRERLDEYDLGLFIKPELISGLKQMGISEKATNYDPEWFWWLPGGDEECFLPLRRRTQFIGSSLSGKLWTYGPEFKTFFKKHLKECPVCREVAEDTALALKQEGIL